MKNIISVVAMVTAIALTGIAVLEAVQKPYPVSDDEIENIVISNPVIDGPTEVVVGELARLGVEGELVQWGCVPAVPDGQSFGPTNGAFVVSFREHGDYTIVASVYSNGVLDQLYHPIKVLGRDPTPAPPVPDDGPDEFNSEVVATVASWARQLDLETTQAEGLAESFASVATEISNGTLRSPSAILERTAQLNSDKDLTGTGAFLAQIQAMLTEKAETGQLSTLDQYYTVWASISKGLATYAATQ